jgi:hypothetical protein
VREGIDANRPPPPGSGRERERKRARERALTGGPPIREAWRADWAGCAVLGRNEFFYFQGISNAFFILFSLQQFMTYIILTK